MIIKTLSSDPAVSLELGRRIAATKRRQPRRSTLGVMWHLLFPRYPVKLARPHA